MNFEGPSVLLVGLMGTGKSTIARQLSTRLDIECLDTDRMIEARTHRTVREIFAEDGESTFREIESEVLGECLGRQVPCVIAGAGGLSFVKRTGTSSIRPVTTGEPLLCGLLLNQRS